MTLFSTPYLEFLSKGLSHIRERMEEMGSESSINNNNLKTSNL
jgi:hypothetical protein